MKQDDFIPSIIEQADAVRLKVQAAQDLAEIKNAAIRHADRMRQYREWVSPKAIAERKERHEKEAAAALALAQSQAKAAREAMGIDEDPPLPDEKDLPPHMRGQSPSTIRAMLRHQRGGAVKRPGQPLIVTGHSGPPMLPLSAWFPVPTVPLARVIQTPPQKPQKETWFQKFRRWFND